MKPENRTTRRNQTGKILRKTEKRDFEGKEVKLPLEKSVPPKREK